MLADTRCYAVSAGRCHEAAIPGGHTAAVAHERGVAPQRGDGVFLRGWVYAVALARLGQGQRCEIFRNFDRLVWNEAEFIRACSAPVNVDEVGFTISAKTKNAARPAGGET